VSAAFVVPLHICEIAVRNAAAEAVEKVHGADWPWSEGFRRSLPRPEEGYNAASDLASVAKRHDSAGKIVAELKFAFWEKLFTVGQDHRLWWPHFRDCFPGAPSQLAVPEARAQMFADLRVVRRLRNRIAHHEPIIGRDMGVEYARIRGLVSWRAASAAAWLDRLQGVAPLVAGRP
jgi:hypothetical protein